MTMQAYAEHRGVSRPAVAKALQSGRISSKSAKKNARGHWEIDAARADVEWSENSVREAPGAEQKRAAEKVAAVDPTDLLLRFNDAAIPVDEEGRPMSRMQVQVIREAALAKQAQLDLAERKGGLIRIEDVKRLLAEIGRETNDGLLAVPARAAAACARETDVATIEIILEQQIVSALQALTNAAGRIK